MRPLAAGELLRDLVRALFGEVVERTFITKSFTCSCALREMSARIRVSSLTRSIGFDCRHLHDRHRRPLPDLGVHRTQHRVLVHQDLVGRQREHGPARHRVVRDDHGHLRRMAVKRSCDLLGRKHEAAGGMDDEVDRDGVRCQPDGAKHLLGVLDSMKRRSGIPSRLTDSWRWISVITREPRRCSSLRIAR